MKASFTALDCMLQDSAHVNAAALDRLVTDYAPNRSLLVHLLDLTESGEPSVQAAATGLLKRYQESGAFFEEGVVKRLLDLLPSTGSWEALLHLLQILPRLAIPRGHADTLCDSLRELSRHQNKFVRAWAYSGLHHLASEFAEYRSDVVPLLERASREESASVRARLRQLEPLDGPSQRLTRRCSQPRPAARQARSKNYEV